MAAGPVLTLVVDGELLDPLVCDREHAGFAAGCNRGSIEIYGDRAASRRAAGKCQQQGNVSDLHHSLIMVSVGSSNPSMKAQAEANSNGSRQKGAMPDLGTHHA